jgi:hypothetical protein
MRYYGRFISGIFLLPMIFFTQGCFLHHQHDHHDSIVGSGRTVTEERIVPACHGIQIVGAAKVFLKQDTRQDVLVEADDNIIDRVVTRCENGYLVVGLESESYTQTTVNVYVSLTTIEDVEILGAGDIVTTGLIQCDTLKCRIEGAGNISLEGNAGVQTIIIDGAGNIDNFDLICSRCTVTINGTGNCEVNVTQRLDATINGVGNIVYEGNPSDVNRSVNGIGRIYPR